MIKVRKLDNDIILVSENLEHVKSVAIGVWVRNGSIDEPKEYAGISHYIEHMLFKGTEKRDAKEIASTADRIGGQINAFTGKEATCYYIKTLWNNWEKGAELLVDMIENSLFDEEEMDRERKVICEEIKMTLDTPDELVMDTIIEQVFAGSVLSQSIIGTPETLNNINRDAIIKYFEDAYTRDSIVVSVAGNIDEDRIADYFEKQFLKLKKAKPARENSKKPYKQSEKIIEKDIEQTHICLGVRGVGSVHEDYFNLSVVNSIFGGTMSSRLFQSIREKQGLAYSVFSACGNYKDDGYFTIYAGVSHDKADQAVKGIKDELLKLRTNGITKDELDMAKEQIKAKYIFAKENVASRMFSMGKNLLILDKVFTLEEILEEIDKVNMETVKNATNLITDTDAYSIAIVTNKKKSH